jgi:hypothetical protein
MYRIVISVGVIPIWLAGLVPALAQDFAQQKEALKVIRETAADICYTVRQQGQQSETQLSGEVQAKLNTVIAKVADLGIKGAGELKSKEYQGVLQEQLAATLAHSADCKKDVFDKLVERMLPQPKGPPPPLPSPRVTGWIVTFATNEAGGGQHRNFPSRTILINTPAAIDFRSSLPADLSSRNVFIAMTASTDQQVTDAGKWVYYVKLIASPSSYTQCTNFEVQSDGIPIGGGAVPILQGAASSTEASMTIERPEGMHTLTIKLACYFQGGQFPVVSLTLKPPSGQWRRPTAGDFTVVKPVNPDVPPDEQSLH